jgi:hypothetical protein
VTILLTNLSVRRPLLGIQQLRLLARNVNNQDQIAKTQLRQDAERTYEGMRRV